VEGSCGAFLFSGKMRSADPFRPNFEPAGALGKEVCMLSGKETDRVRLAAQVRLTLLEELRKAEAEQNWARFATLLTMIQASK
jgi:hypothetical protein